MWLEPHSDASYVSPVSPKISGTRFATGANVASKQDVELQVFLP